MGVQVFIDYDTIDISDIGNIHKLLIEIHSIA